MTLNSTQREIQDIYNRLGKWGLLSNLSTHEKLMIKNDLKRIAQYAISEYKGKCNNLIITIDLPS